VGRLPPAGGSSGAGVTRRETAEASAARHLVGRGFRRSTSRPMKPGEFDRLKSAKRGEYHVLYIPRPEDSGAEVAS